jgi:hypothetical protein
VGIPFKTVHPDIRLGKSLQGDQIERISPFGWLFPLGSFFENSRNSPKFMLLRGLATFWAIFSQTHPVHKNDDLQNRSYQKSDLGVFPIEQYSIK